MTMKTLTNTAGWKRAIRTMLLALAALSAPAAFAQCAGFTDVPNDGPTGFCPSVEWVKNRSVTSGCGDGTTYCPQNTVTRLAMAAFMKRLGDALTPVQLVMDLRPGGVDIDANVVVCQTADLNVAGFPRTAYVDATLSATATADVSFAADVAMSTDGGATWTVLNPNANHGSVPANQFGSLSDIGSANLNVSVPPQNVRFGLRLSRGSVVSATDLTDSRCQTRALIYSRTGASSPFCRRCFAANEGRASGPRRLCHRLPAAACSDLR